MTPPRYVGLQREDIPAIPTPGGLGQVHLIAGEWSGQRGPIESLTGVFMATVELQPGARVEFAHVEGRNVFLYGVRGRYAVGGTEVQEHALAELSLQGDTVAIEARTAAMLVLGHAAPIGEPVVSHGPFVMNTRAEIQRAIDDYQAGRFGPIAL
jgi:redox-sensitive bicupin YhaK (pirin superfamily)